MLEFYNNFVKTFCDTYKYEELEMNTNYFYLALSVEKLGRRFHPEKQDVWNALCSDDCTDTFTANETDSLFPRKCCNTHLNYDKREPGLSEEEF